MIIPICKLDKLRGSDSTHFFVDGGLVDVRGLTLNWCDGAAWIIIDEMLDDHVSKGGPNFAATRTTNPCCQATKAFVGPCIVSRPVETATVRTIGAV